MSTPVSAPGQGTASTQHGQPAVHPVILLTPDIETPVDNPTEAEYVVRANYMNAVAELGGVPMILPYGQKHIAVALDICDGVVITGSRPGATVAPTRKAFETALITAVVDAQVPLLGICHGMQLIGQHLGGRVVSDLAENDREHPLHIPFDVPNQVAHPITITDDSRLRELAGQRIAQVNSLHQHALEGPGRFRVAARAMDGVIEAIEGETLGFCLGVQWHPEYRLTELDHQILAMFVERCAERAQARRTHRGAGGAHVSA